MELHNTTNWSDFLQPVLAAYNNTKHSATGVAPNDVNSKNETQIAMKLRSKAKTGSYPDVNEGDNVRIQMIHKTPKGFKQQWSTELHTVQKDYHNGVYKVDNNLYPRKEIQLVKGDVIKLPEKPKQQQVIINKKDKIGKAANHPHVKQLMNTKTPDYQAVETMMNSGKPARAIKKVVKMNL
jgi:hypothetical protein